MQVFIVHTVYICTYYLIINTCNSAISAVACSYQLLLGRGTYGGAEAVVILLL